MEALKVANHSVVKAKLTMPITYKKDGLEILVPAATLIFVDLEENIALVGDDHMDVIAEEFEVISQ